MLLLVLTLKMWFYSFEKKKKSSYLNVVLGQVLDQYQAVGHLVPGFFFPGSNLHNPPTHVTLMEEESREWH